MSSPIIFHTQHSINCTKIFNQFIKGDKYIKYYNKYLIPYRCNHINHPYRMIYGNFVYPMYNTLKKSILSKGTTFNYSYIKGNEFITEFNPTTLRDYNIFSQTFLYPNGIEVCEHTLQPKSILFFSIDKAIAEPLIQNQLL
jgi:hypothetical protein